MATFHFGDAGGSKGRGIDHIGFEVKNLDAFVKNLEAQGVKMDAAVRQGNSRSRS